MSGRVGISLVSIISVVRARSVTLIYFTLKLVGEPFDVEGYPQAPLGLVLEQVHVYVRHGVS